MIDFNTIYEAISPYVGTGAIATFIVVALALVVNIRSKLKGVTKTVDAFMESIKKAFEETENEALKAFKKALPTDFAVNIESLTKAEIASIKEYFITAINENWLMQMQQNNALMSAMANALISIKSVPDSSKKEIAEILKLNTVTTTDKVKVSLKPLEDDEVVIEKVEEKKPIISVD